MPTFTDLNQQIMKHLFLECINGRGGLTREEIDQAFPNVDRDFMYEAVNELWNDGKIQCHIIDQFQPTTQSWVAYIKEQQA